MKGPLAVLFSYLLIGMQHFFMFQDRDNDCGPVSLKILLAHCFNNRQWLQLIEDWHRPSSFQTLMDAAATCGIQLTGYQIHDHHKWLSIRGPFIVHQSIPTPHFFVAKKTWFHYFWVYDPARKPYLISLKKLLFKTSKKVLIVTKITKKEHPQHFVIPHIPIIFLRMTYILMTLWSMTLLLFPSFEFMSFLTFFMVIFLGIWLLYVYHLYQHHASNMDKLYAHWIVNEDQFKLFYQIKKQSLLIPLQHLYGWTVLTLILFYTLSASIILSLSLIVFLLTYFLLTRPLSKKMADLYQHIVHQENKMTFPLHDDLALKKLQSKSDRYVFLVFIKELFLYSLAIITLWCLYLFIPSLNSLQWILAFTLFILSEKTRQLLMKNIELRQTLPTLIQQFIHHHNMVK
jgi:hypothetical protein